jgi:hypothetical protein
MTEQSGQPEFDRALELAAPVWFDVGEMVGEETLPDIAAELNECRFLNPLISPVRGFALVGVLQFACKYLDPDSYSGTAAREIAESLISQFSTLDCPATAGALQLGWEYGAMPEPEPANSAVNQLLKQTRERMRQRMAAGEPPGVSEAESTRVLASHVFAVEWLVAVIAAATGDKIILVDGDGEQVITPDTLLATAYRIGIQKTGESSFEEVAAACVRALGCIAPVPPGGD